MFSTGIPKARLYAKVADRSVQKRMMGVGGHENKLSVCLSNAVRVIFELHVLSFKWLRLNIVTQLPCIV